jgi:hypothetical protein
VRARFDVHSHFYEYFRGRMNVVSLALDGESTRPARADEIENRSDVSDP